jgi:hypothetical protein
MDAGGNMNMRGGGVNISIGILEEPNKSIFDKKLSSHRSPVS